VTNPQPASGGADPDAVDDIRLGAPASVRAFNRAVSAEDYAALALSFPGVAKASSLWITRDESLRPVVHPYIQLTVAAANQLPLADQPVFAAKLRRFLDQRRDPNVSLRIVDFTPVFLDVAVTVDIGDRYPRGATLASAQAALRPSPNPGGSPGFFAFDRLQFGESIHLSAVYAALLAVPGVADANITTLRRTDQPAGANNVQTAIFIRPTEIAAIGTDPSALNQGSLTVSLGQGGFADQ
jgi:predicted phage baseplate assembly protein